MTSWSSAIRMRITPGSPPVAPRLWLLHPTATAASVFPMSSALFRIRQSCFAQQRSRARVKYCANRMARRDGMRDIQSTFDAFHLSATSTRCLMHAAMAKASRSWPGYFPDSEWQPGPIGRFHFSVSPKLQMSCSLAGLTGSPAQSSTRSVDSRATSLLRAEGRLAASGAMHLAATWFRVNNTSSNGLRQNARCARVGSVVLIFIGAAFSDACCAAVS
jgi:hypothetical protein